MFINEILFVDVNFENFSYSLQKIKYNLIYEQAKSLNKNEQI